MFLSSQHYHCQQCGRCCRRFLIPISRLEIEAISKLPWPKAQDSREQCYAKYGARTYLRVNPVTTECLYLEDGRKCRMHAAFGSKCKTISCRAYPFEFLRTFGNEITVAGRFDCPAIQDDAGEPLEHYRIDLEDILADPLMGALPPPFTPEQLEGLEQKTVEKIADFLKNALRKSNTPVPAMGQMCRRLRQLGPVFANDLETLEVVLPSMLEKATQECLDPKPVIGLNWPQRSALRKMMLEAIRFDRVQPDFSFGARLRQAKYSAQFLWGFGNPRAFGPDEPDVQIRNARLFDNDAWEYADDAWECYRRCLAVRLESRQFFGAAYYRKSFYDGLQALLDTWPLAVLLARLHAAATDHPLRVEAADVKYATGLIDHCHGRRVRL